MPSSSTTVPHPACSPGRACSRRVEAAGPSAPRVPPSSVKTAAGSSPDDAAGPATSYASSGTTPFGFAFGRHDDLVVSEAAGAAPLSAASSYELSKDGTLTAVSRSVPTTQAAACWVAVTKDGRYAFTANAASDSISAFSVDKDGALTLVFAQAAHSTGAHTTDMALTENSRYLYANDGGTHMISAFRVEADGSLTRLPGVTIPVGASGLAAQ